MCEGYFLFSKEQLIGSISNRGSYYRYKELYDKLLEKYKLKTFYDTNKSYYLLTREDLTELQSKITKRR